MPRETARIPNSRGSSRSREEGRGEAPFDARIAEVARRQYGVVARQQLLQLEMTEREIDYRLAIRRLHPIHQEVYSVGHLAVPRQGRWLAAVLASGPHAALSHWSAAALWMVRPNARSMIDVTTPHKSRSWDGIRRHHKALPADEVAVEEGIPVTSVPRTIFDLAATEDVDTVAAMLRESEHRNLWDRLSLLALVDRNPGRRGVKKVRRALRRVTEEPAGRTRSKLEQRFAPF